MGKINFQVDDDMGRIVAIMRRVATLAERHNCTFNEGHLSENGKKFSISGKDSNLKTVQEKLRREKLPQGNFHSDQDVKEFEAATVRP